MCCPLPTPLLPITYQLREEVTHLKPRQVEAASVGPQAGLVPVLGLPSWDHLRMACPSLGTTQGWDGAQCLSWVPPFSISQGLNRPGPLMGCGASAQLLSRPQQASDRTMGLWPASAQSEGARWAEGTACGPTLSL